MAEAAKEIMEEVAKERPVIRKIWEKMKAAERERAKKMKELVKEIQSASAKSASAKSASAKSASAKSASRNQLLEIKSASAKSASRPALVGAF